jgi:hypothetical protein
MLKVYGSLFNIDMEKLKSVVDLLINKTLLNERVKGYLNMLLYVEY